MNLTEIVIRVAKASLGQQEKKGNSGFKSAEFEKQMKATGWLPSQSWCAYFTEYVWKTAFAEAKHPLFSVLDKLFSGSATATAANFQQNTNFKTGSRPETGALAVWRYGNTWKGHIGIVSEIMPGGAFKCIEGNTNAAGGREGIMVAEKYRSTGETFKPKGLNLICFVYLP